MGRKAKLTIEALPDIQTRHDKRESIFIIGASYQVSHQTIINFLNRYGDYNPGLGRPRTRNPKELFPFDIIDIMDMVKSKKTIRQIANHYQTEVFIVERFIEKYKSVRITRLPIVAKFDTNIVLPTIHRYFE